jgi:hypothetical protein
MKSFRVISAAGIFLFFTTMVPAYAQHDQPGDKQGNSGKKRSDPQRAKQPQQGQQAKQAQPQRAQQPQKRQQQKQPQQPQRAQQRPQPQRQRTQQEARTWQQQRGWLQKGGWQGHDSWQKNRAQHWATDHRTWAQRGGYGGYYIPQTTFGLYFGSQHFFRIHTRPVIYMGYPRFTYGGFSFLMLDPWPEYWSESWYDSDDVYIDYDDGYYLYNRRYPQVSLAVTIVL